jgi:hypothetical protein
MITDDPKEGQVHMTGLGEIRAEVGILRRLV